MGGRPGSLIVARRPLATAQAIPATNRGGEPNPNPQRSIR